MTGHIVVCLGGFPGAATARQACRWLADGIRTAGRGHEVIELPVMAGREGRIEALTTAGYRLEAAEVAGPDGDPVTAVFAVRGDRAVIEVVQTPGSTYGTGQLIAKALDLGCRDLVLALGGNAATDGGIGMLQALGASLATEQAGPVSVDLTGLDDLLSGIRLTLAVDPDQPPSQCGFAALATLGARQTTASRFFLTELGQDRVLEGAALAVAGPGDTGYSPASIGAAGVPVVTVGPYGPSMTPVELSRLLPEIGHEIGRQLSPAPRDLGFARLDRGR